MPDSTLEIQTPAAQSSMTDEMLAWVHRFTNIDPRPVQSAAPAAAPSTPAEFRADTERRVAAHRATYDKLGSVVGDDIAGPKDKLSSSEQKIGKAVVDDGRAQTVYSKDGARTQAVTANGKSAQTIIDEKGITTSNKTTVSGARIGKDGKAEEWSASQSESLNIGMGNITKTTGSSSTIEGNGVKATNSEQTVKSLDLAKAEASRAALNTNEYKDTAGTVTRDIDKRTQTLGMSGYSNTQENSHQVDKKVDGKTVKQFDSTATTTAFTRGAGQAGLNFGETVKSGQMKDGVEPLAQFMDTGHETTDKQNIGLVSDDKGIGIGTSHTTGEKDILGKGASISRDFTRGGKIQTQVKEVPNSNPPKFQITTTISFDLSLSAGASVEMGRPEALAKDAGENTSVAAPFAKGTGSAGVTASAGGTASFKRDLTEAEAQKYLEDIRQNGRGSKLPEHQILATGAKDGVAAAKHVWDTFSGSVEAAADLKPGEEMETSAQVGVAGKLGVKGGIVSADGSAAKTHKVGVKKTGLPGDKIQVTVTIDDQTDLAGSISATYGAVTGTGTGTKGWGAGKTMVFVLDKMDPAQPGQKNPGLTTQLALFGGLAGPDDLDQLAKDHPELLASQTKRTSDSDSLGVTVSVGAPPGIPAGPLAAQATVTGKGTQTHEETTDNKGQLLSTKDTGASQVEYSAGVGSDLKAKGGDTGTYTGETLRDTETGKVIAKGKTADDHKSFDFGKTEDNLIAAVNDPLGAFLNPAKLLGEKLDSTGLTLNDDDFMALCQSALHKQKWDGVVGGHRHDEWVETGDKIRACITVKDGAIVETKKPEIQKALASWSKAKDGGRTEALNGLLRPEDGPGDGPVKGKATAWPDGTQQYQAIWDDLMGGTQLDAARAKMKKDPRGAAADVDAYHDKLIDFRDTLEGRENKWSAVKATYAEMMGHITARLSETKKLEHDIAKLSHISAASAANNAGDREAREREENKSQMALMFEFNDHRKNLETHFNTSFETLWKYEQFLLGKTELDHDFLRKSMKDMRYELKTWEDTYKAAYKIWEQMKPMHTLDGDTDPEDLQKLKGEMEKLHPHGAQERFAKFEPTLQKQLAA